MTIRLGTTRRLLVGAALSLLAMAAGACPSQAQDQQTRCPAPRTVFTFSDSTSIEALGGANPPFCRFRDTRGGQLVDLLLGAFSASSPIVQTNAPVLQELLPLQVGKTIHLTRSASGERNWQATVTIETHETIAVPAGRLACFVVLWTEPSGQGRWERRWWYCPALGLAAKYTAKFEVTNASAGRTASSPASWELVQIRVP
jgi:hypothetical protein